MIPKIIHQTYKSIDLPETFKMCQDKVIELHPDFEYRFYTDKDMYEFIEKDFPDYYENFMKLPRKIMQVDMFRYFLMYKYGGLYLDMDYLMFKKYDLLDYKIVIPSNRVNEEGYITCVGNCFFASIPGHDFWKKIIDTINIIDRTIENFKVNNNILYHKDGTGPGFLFEMIKEYKKRDEICLPVKKLFHPPATNTNKEYISSIKNGGAYGIHLCTGTWLNT